MQASRSPPSVAGGTPGDKDSTPGLGTPAQQVYGHHRPATIVTSPTIPVGTTSSAFLSHYSLLATTELLGLPKPDQAQPESAARRLAGPGTGPAGRLAGPS
jgi:hypothetical protein